MGKSYVQTDAVAACGAIVACSGAVLASSTMPRESSEGATPGIEGVNVTYQALSSGLAGIMFQSPAVGEKKWDAGQWTVIFNHTALILSGITLEAVYVCRVDSGCNVVGTVGSVTGLAQSVTGLGLYPVNIMASESNGATTDSFYIVGVFDNGSASVRTLTWTPNQTIATPIVASLPVSKTPAVDLISMAEGQAVNMLITVPSDSVRIRIIRRDDAVPTTETDVGPGVTIFDGHPSTLSYNGHTRELIDFSTADRPLLDGKAYFYGVFSRDNDGTWSAGATGTVTPNTRLTLQSPNAVGILRDRLREKMKALMQTDKFSDLFTKEKKSEGIDVFRSYPLDRAHRWPCVSVHLDAAAPAEDYIGQAGSQAIGIYPDRRVEQRASHFRTLMTVIGWSFQEDERDVLRQLLEAAIYGDLVFYELAGLEEFSMDGPKDAESFDMGAPMYHSIVEITCKTMVQPIVSTTQQVMASEGRHLVLVDSGLLEAATDTLLTDTDQAWFTNQWTLGQGMHLVRITSGAGAGQQRHIVANTSTTLSVDADDPFSTTPSAGDSYEIYRIEEPVADDDDDSVQYQSFN